MQDGPVSTTEDSFDVPLVPDAHVPADPEELQIPPLTQKERKVIDTHLEHLISAVRKLAELEAPEAVEENTEAIQAILDRTGVGITNLSVTSLRATFCEGDEPKEETLDHADTLRTIEDLLVRTRRRLASVATRLDCTTSQLRKHFSYVGDLADTEVELPYTQRPVNISLNGARTMCSGIVGHFVDFDNRMLRESAGEELPYLQRLRILFAGLRDSTELMLQKEKGETFPLPAAPGPMERDHMKPYFSFCKAVYFDRFDLGSYQQVCFEKSGDDYVLKHQKASGKTADQLQVALATAEAVLNTIDMVLQIADGSLEVGGKNEEAPQAAPNPGKPEPDTPAAEQASPEAGEATPSPLEMTEEEYALIARLAGFADKTIIRPEQLRENLEKLKPKQRELLLETFSHWALIAITRPGHSIIDYLQQVKYRIGKVPPKLVEVYAIACGTENAFFNEDSFPLIRNTLHSFAEHRQGNWPLKNEAFSEDLLQQLAALLKLTFILISILRAANEDLNNIPVIYVRKKLGEADEGEVERAYLEHPVIAALIAAEESQPAPERIEPPKEEPPSPEDEPPEPEPQPGIFAEALAALSECWPEQPAASESPQGDQAQLEAMLREAAAELEQQDKTIAGLNAMLLEASKDLDEQDRELLLRPTERKGAGTLNGSGKTRVSEQNVLTEKELALSELINPASELYDEEESLRYKLREALSDLETEKAAEIAAAREKAEKKPGAQPERILLVIRKAKSLLDGTQVTDIGSDRAFCSGFKTVIDFRKNLSERSIGDQFIERASEVVNQKLNTIRERINALSAMCIAINATLGRM
jgi:hypothetical protein